MFSLFQLNNILIVTWLHPLELKYRFLLQKNYLMYTHYFSVLKDPVNVVQTLHQQ